MKFLENGSRPQPPTSPFERGYVAARRHANYMHWAGGIHECRHMCICIHVHIYLCIYIYICIMSTYLICLALLSWDTWQDEDMPITCIGLEVYMNVDIFDLSGSFERGYLAGRRRCDTERGASRPLLRWRSTPSPLASCSVLQLVAVRCSVL